MFQAIILYLVTRAYRTTMEPVQKPRNRLANPQGEISMVPCTLCTVAYYNLPVDDLLHAGDEHLHALQTEPLLRRPLLCQEILKSSRPRDPETD